MSVTGLTFPRGHEADDDHHRDRARRGGTLEGHWVSLRAASEADLGWIYQLESRPELIARYRLRGETPSPEDFRSRLWAGTLANFVIEGRASGEPVGLFSIFGSNQACTRAQVGLAIEPEHQRAGWPMEGLFVGLRYAFSTWPLEKVYFESAEGNREPVGAGYAKFATAEVVLPEHLFLDGRYEDVHVFGLTRAAWDAIEKVVQPGAAT